MIHLCTINSVKNLDVEISFVGFNTSTTTFNMAPLVAGINHILLLLNLGYLIVIHFCYIYYIGILTVFQLVVVGEGGGGGGGGIDMLFTNYMISQKGVLV